MGHTALPSLLGAAVSHQQLNDIRQYAAAGAAVDAVADSPTSASLACYLRIVSTAGGTSLVVVTGAGNTRTLTVKADQEFDLDFSAITAATTAGPVQVGWR
jgi:hypothetical protein